MPGGLGSTVRIVWAVLREAGWWLGGGLRLMGRHVWRSLVWAWAVGTAVLFQRWTIVAVIAAVVVVPVLGLGLWARLGPVSYERWASGPARRRKMRRWLRRNWLSVMEACGLTRRVAASEGPAAVQAPGRGRLCWVSGQLVATPRLLIGQTLDDVEAVTDRLRVSLNARRVRIVPNRSLTECQIVWAFGDLLAEPFDATVPEPHTAVASLATVGLGRTEDGDVWRLPLGVSTLTAGSSGSGKASLIWGLVFAVAPAIRSGLVQVHGVDLKGGMELSMGRPLFTRYAQQAEQAVTLLEEAVQALQARAARLAGHTRQHTPSVVEPLVLVLIDELAALIAYLPERDLMRRAEAALNVLLSQGRAVGFFVFAFLQDPRKETVKMRHLFTQSLGLRLKDREEVAMVLSDGAVAAGAWCHKIPRSTPGVGYVLGSEDGRPVKVRAGYVSDQMIRACAARFPAPTQIPVVVAEPEPRPSRSRRADTARTSSSSESSSNGTARRRKSRSATNGTVEW